MAVRPKKPQQGNTVAAAAVFVLAGLATSPALAAPDHDVLCDKSHQATLEVSESELAATPVNTSDEMLRDHLLKPRVDAKAREVFDDADEEAEVDEQVDEQVDGGPDDTDTAVRSLSDRKVLPLKRQMYRRDI